MHTMKLSGSKVRWASLPMTLLLALTLTASSPAMPDNGKQKAKKSKPAQKLGNNQDPCKNGGGGDCKPMGDDPPSHELSEAAAIPPGNGGGGSGNPNTTSTAIQAKAGLPTTDTQKEAPIGAQKDKDPLTVKAAKCGGNSNLYLLTFTPLSTTTGEWEVHYRPEARSAVIVNSRELANTYRLDFSKGKVTIPLSAKVQKSGKFFLELYKGGDVRKTITVNCLCSK